MELPQTNRYWKDIFLAILVLLSSCSLRETCSNLMDETINRESYLRELVRARLQNGQVRISHHSKKMVNLVLFFALALAECDLFWLVTLEEALGQKECNENGCAVVSIYFCHLRQ